MSGTINTFHEFYRSRYEQYSLGEAFCIYFNVDNAKLRAEKDDTIARPLVDEYFRKWGAD